MTLATLAVSRTTPEIKNKVADKNSVAENIERSIQHYSSINKILLVGEGDFSFSACLARAFGSGHNMIATSLDPFGAVMKYSRARENLAKLIELGCTILHDVDALTMKRHPVLRSIKFDIIIFNFPHAGFHHPERDQRQISLHQDLVIGFFKSASKLLSENGQVHVTHKTTEPYNMWCIKSLGKQNGFVLKKKAGFSRSDYPGYVNKRGSGAKFDTTFPIGQCKTFIFKKVN